jgi:N-acetylmuramoyl-L-alanine amidase
MKRSSSIAVIAVGIVLGFWLWVPPVLAGPPPAEAAYQKARRAYYRFRDDKEKHKFRHNWKNIAGKFEKVAQDFPDSSRAPDALFTAGKLYKGLYLISRVDKDLDHSLELFRKLVKDFPDNHLADDAQLYIALKWIEFKKDPAKARKELTYLVDTFPDGDVTPRARGMLEDLGGPKEKVAEKPKTAGVDTGIPAKEAKPAETGKEPKKETGPVLEKIQHWSNPGYTRIALYTRAKVGYKVGRLAGEKKTGKPPRLYIDLMDTELGDELTGSVSVSDSVVSGIRFAERDEGFIRIVVDLTDDHTHRVFPMSTPDRVVVDITAREDSVATVIGEKLPPEKIESDTGKKKTKKKPRTPTKKEVEKLKTRSKPGVSLSMMAGLKVKRIVVDAGHGGKDPGAIGPTGTLEKEITLDVAKRLAKLLKDKLKLEVLLTRKKDRFIPLEGRTAFANKRNADLFVSIHFNAHPNRKFHGVETFYLDLTNDRYSIKLAARENATSEKSISDLKFILADLALKSHVDDSISLSKYIQKAMVGSLRRKYKSVRDMGIKPALFYVLIGARMPSILVEGSFLTNPMEEKRLKTKSYRQSLAEGIFTGIKNFISERDQMLDPDR